MVNWRNVRLILHREVRDQLRDRRTLFMIAVLPLLLYPALGIGMVQLTILFAEQPRTVVLLGQAHLPPTPQLLKGDRFDSTWFLNPADAEKLHVVADGAPPAEPADADAARRAARLIAAAREIRHEREREQSLQADADAAEAKWHDLARRWERASAAATTTGEPATAAAVSAAEQDYEQRAELVRQCRLRQVELLRSAPMQALVLIPEGLAEHLEAINKNLAERGPGVKGVARYPRPEIVFNKADDKSQITHNRVREAMNAWDGAILKTQLALAHLPDEFPHPVQPTSTNLSRDGQESARLWGQLFPILLVTMALTGAFYPAIDLCAGEKERGTMETLLICPATRTEIVLGKFFTVMVFSCMTALLNLVSMGLTGRHIASMSGGTASAAQSLALPGPAALFWIVLLLIPLATLFSALCLALATFARSTKEGQYYLTPLLIVTLGLVVFCASPGVEIEPLYSVLPVAGVALLLKGLLLSSMGAVKLALYAVPVLATSVGYSALAIWWAIDQFSREDVLFREAERLDVALWVKHLLRDKEPTPGFAEALICFILIMFLQFGAMRVLTQASSAADSAGAGIAAMRVLLVQQLVIIAFPALMMGVMLTTSLRQTFRLNWPGWQILTVAAVLPFFLHPLTVELAASLHDFFPPLPVEIQGVLKNMSNENLPLWLVLLAFAAAPALCEEIAFRGFMLSGFYYTRRTGLAIGLTSVAFGLMHMIPQQVFNASLLGLVLGLIALGSDSLLPCIVFHFGNNALAVMHSRFGDQVPGALLTSIEDGQLRYRWPTLLLAAVAAGLVLRWLARRCAHHAAPRAGAAEPQANTAEQFSPHGV